MTFLRQIWPALMLVSAFLGGWEAYVTVTGASPLILPAPSDVLNGLRVERAQIAGMQPAAAQGFRRRLGIVQIALHHGVAAQHQFADGLAVSRHRGHGFGVQDRLVKERRVAHPLTRHFKRLVL